MERRLKDSKYFSSEFYKGRGKFSYGKHASHRDRMKLPILLVKDKLHKILVRKGFVSDNSTKSCPKSKPLTEEQLIKIENYVIGLIDNLDEQYQEPLIQNVSIEEHKRFTLTHMVVHFERYIKCRT